MKPLSLFVAFSLSLFLIPTPTRACFNAVEASSSEWNDSIRRAKSLLRQGRWQQARDVFTRLESHARKGKRAKSATRSRNLIDIVFGESKSQKEMRREKAKVTEAKKHARYLKALSHIRQKLEQRIRKNANVHPPKTVHGLLDNSLPKDDPRLRQARAELQLANGKTKQALAELRALAHADLGNTYSFYAALALAERLSNNPTKAETASQACKKRAPKRMHHYCGLIQAAKIH